MIIYLAGMKEAQNTADLAAKTLNFSIIAQKKANQTKVNKCVRALLAYNKANDERDIIENNDLPSNAINRKCENLFDRYLEAAADLPKYELKPIEKALY